MTQQEYETAVATHDQRIIDQQIARIPLNVNRAGRHYKKLVKQIYENTPKRNHWSILRS